MIFLLLSGLAGCKPGKEHYSAEGTVVAVHQSDRKIKIAHGDIPGYMPAMTMTFEVAPDVPLGGLSAGDRVSFGFDAWPEHIRITEMKKIGAGKENDTKR
jgi:Cu/Ag efflux protein CusF